MDHSDILVMIALHNFKDTYNMLAKLKEKLLKKTKVMTDGEITGVVKLAVFNMAMLKYKTFLVHEEQQRNKSDF